MWTQRPREPRAHKFCPLREEGSDLTRAMRRADLASADAEDASKSSLSENLKAKEKTPRAPKMEGGSHTPSSWGQDLCPSPSPPQGGWDLPALALQAKLRRDGAPSAADRAPAKSGHHCRHQAASPSRCVTAAGAEHSAGEKPLGRVEVSGGPACQAAASRGCWLEKEWVGRTDQILNPQPLGQVRRPRPPTAYPSGKPTQGLVPPASGLSILWSEETSAAPPPQETSTD